MEAKIPKYTCSNATGSKRLILMNNNEVLLQSNQGKTVVETAPFRSYTQFRMWCDNYFYKKN